MVSGQRVQPTLLHVRRTLRRNELISLLKMSQAPLLHNVEASELLPSEIEGSIHDSSLWYPSATDAPIFPYLTPSELARPLMPYLLPCASQNSAYEGAQIEW